MLSKKKLLESINSLPDKFSVEDLLDRVILLQKIEIGVEEVEKGNVVDNYTAKEQLAKWLK